MLIGHVFLLVVAMKSVLLVVFKTALLAIRVHFNFINVCNELCRFLFFLMLAAKVTNRTTSNISCYVVKGAGHRRLPNHRLGEWWSVLLRDSHLTVVMLIVKVLQVVRLALTPVELFHFICIHD